MACGRLTLGLMLLITFVFPAVRALWQLPPLGEKRDDLRAASTGNLIAFAGGVRYATRIDISGLSSRLCSLRYPSAKFTVMTGTRA